jgi:hypothetical protein
LPGKTDRYSHTPAFDGERLYVPGIRDVLVCLDAMNGKEVWRVDFVEVHSAPVPAFGFVSSPLVDGEFVYVQAGAAVRKLNKRTGKEIWSALKDEGGMWGSAFSSPVVARLAGQTQVVVQTREKLAGLDEDSGQCSGRTRFRLSRHEYFNADDCRRPDLTSSYGGKSLAFTIAKLDQTLAASEQWENKTQVTCPPRGDRRARLSPSAPPAVCLHRVTTGKAWTTKPYGKCWSLVARSVNSGQTNGESYCSFARIPKIRVARFRKISGLPRGRIWPFAGTGVCATKRYDRLSLGIMCGWRLGWANADAQFGRFRRLCEYAIEVLE